MTLPNPAKSIEVNEVQPAKKSSPRLVTLSNPAKLMEVYDVQPNKKPFPRLVTFLNPEKLMEVNDLQSDKKRSPRLVTLLNPAKSMEVNDVQPDKKRSPRLAILLNPAKLMVVNDVQPDKKSSLIAATANGALRSRIRRSVLARKLFGIAVTTSACRNNFATSGSFTRTSLLGVKSVSSNARRAAMDCCFIDCVNTTVSPAFSAVMLMSSPSSFPPRSMPKLSSANPVVVATFRCRSFAVSSTSTSTKYVLPSNPSILISIRVLCVFCCGSGARHSK